MKNTVLLIEDDQAFQAALSAFLAENGFGVAVASTARDASLKLGNQKFSCIITELKLSKGNGVIELLNNLKNLSPNQGTPVLIASAAVDRAVLEQLKGKINGILLKPFPMETLLQKLAELDR